MNILAAIFIMIGLLGASGFIANGIAEAGRSIENGLRLISYKLDAGKGE